MKKLISIISLLFLISNVYADKVYRCGNEYTNDEKVYSKRNDCRLLDESRVSIIQENSSSSSSRSSNSTNIPKSSNIPKVTSKIQQSRDVNARAILEIEISKVEEKLASLKAEYKEGMPEKTAIELKNQGLYTNRTNSLKNDINRYENDLESLQRELSRLN